ncbi:chaperone modulator CbpM [Bacteroidales bacterium OttesenSCG-928-M11]|nr:chaperone modulator CbpM [Bacteroidales bacterium OttesenSCG-928-M11]
MKAELVIISEYIKYSDIKLDFLSLLEENELIHIYEIDNNRYLHHDELPEIEKYARLYYELSINMEGIDVIHHLLNHIREMQDEMKDLKGRLKFYD